MRGRVFEVSVEEEGEVVCVVLLDWEVQGVVGMGRGRDVLANCTRSSTVRFVEHWIRDVMCW